MTETGRNVLWKELELLDDAYRAGVEIPRERLTRTISLSSRTGSMELVEQVGKACIRLMPDHQWVRTSVAAAYARLGAPEKVLALINEMKATGIKNLKPKLEVWSVLVAAYAKAGERGKAMTTIDRMQEEGHKPDVVTFNSLIKAHTAIRDMESAFSVFELMKGRKIAPNSITYSTLIHGCLKRGHYQDAQWLVSDMESRHIKPTLAILTSFLYNNSRANAFDKAQSIMQRLAAEGWKADRITYTAIMEGMARNGLSDQALVIFEKMLEQGGTPDAITYTSLIKAFANQPDRCWAFYEDMTHRGIIADFLFYHTLIATQIQTTDNARLNVLIDKAINALYDLHSCKTAFVANLVVASRSATAASAKDDIFIQKLLKILEPRPTALQYAQSRLNNDQQ